MARPRDEAGRSSTEQVQAHYDLGNDFFALFLDPSMTYSCARFETPGMSLADAQRAKIDLSLAKCELRPGMKLLDIGCGWGATAHRAAGQHRCKVVALTVSRNQHAHNAAAATPDVDFRLQGWEDFTEKVDRIVSIGAFEHFGRDRYPAFFARCRELLPDGGVMLLHTITLGRPSRSFAFLRFMHFISREVFPGGDLPQPERVIESGRLARFEVVHVESLRPDYVRTLECWASSLEANRERATALAGEGVYQTYIRYLTGAAQCFRDGSCNVYQFKMRAT